MELDFLDRAIVARVPALIKAETPDASGRRIVSVEASTEEKDTDGDVVLQKSLLDSAALFVAEGHLDIDHKSEIGYRMNPPITDMASYIVGRPLDVWSSPGGRTFVKGEINRSVDGTDDPSRSRADELWASLRRDPPVQWFASIYGFPIDLDDCRYSVCVGTNATRFVIKSLQWRSLAFTRTPKNTALASPTQIVTAKAYLVELAKAMPVTDIALAGPQTMDDVYAASDCPTCRVQEAPSLLGYRRHFAKCRGYATGVADIAAHAMMHKCNMSKALLCRT